jgi:uncharacterized membrane protein YebE (DUF533 family)
MKSQDMAIVKSLVSVAWADGEFHDKEREMVDALLAAFSANENESQFLREYAAEQKTLDDLPLNDLSPDDRRLVLQHAVLLTHADKDQHEAEKKFLEALQKKLEIPDDEAKAIMSIAEERAKRFLNLL